MILLQNESPLLSAALKFGYDSTQEKIMTRLDNPTPYVWNPARPAGALAYNFDDAVYQTVAAHSVRLQGKSVDQVFMDEVHKIGSLPAFQ